MKSFKKKFDKLKKQLGRDLTALVTGASSGIGLTYATELANAGCNLLIVSNQEKELKEEEKKLKEKFGVSVISRYQDLSQQNAAQQLFDFCREQNLYIDILINNAGIFFFHELNKDYDSKMESMLQLHIMTPTHLCRLFGDEMKKCGFGYLVNISSMAAKLPLPGITTYSATKAYLRSLGKSLYFEMRDYGVGVSTVCPGAIATPLYKLNSKIMHIGINLGLIATPQWLVNKAIKGMLHKKRVISPGAMNVYLPTLFSILPNGLINRIWRKVK